MPLYEYQCDGCGNRFERIQKFSDPLVDTCPKCGQPAHRLVSSPAFQFKGSGWYVTDYARAGKTDGEGGGAAPAAGKDSTDSKDPKGATDTKPATESAPVADKPKGAPASTKPE